MLKKILYAIINDLSRVISNKISDFYHVLVFLSASTIILWLILMLFTPDTIEVGLFSWWIFIFMSWGLLRAETRVRIEGVKKLILFMYHKFGNVIRLVGSIIIILLFIASFFNFNKLSFITNDFLYFATTLESGLSGVALGITSLLFVALIFVSIFAIATIITTLQEKLTGYKKILSVVVIIILILFMVFVYGTGGKIAGIIAIFLDNNLNWLFRISLLFLHLNYLAEAIKNQINKYIYLPSK